MVRRLVPTIYRMVESEPDIAVVRCAPGDTATFWALVVDQALKDMWWDFQPASSRAEVLAAAQERVKPPMWRWFRMNVCSPADRDALGWLWTLGWPDGPGPGNWQGALVTYDWSHLWKPTSP